MLLAERGDGSHVGVMIPTGSSGLGASMQEAVWFDLGSERASDVVLDDDGIVVAGLAGGLVVVPPGGGELTVLDVEQGIPSPLIEVAYFDDEDPRLVVASDGRLLVQETLAGNDLDLYPAGTTTSTPVFIDTLIRPDVSKAPFLGVVEGSDFTVVEMLDLGSPELGVPTAADQLPVSPLRAFWREVEASAQVLAFSEDSNHIDWFRVNFDGTMPLAAPVEIPEVDEILDVLAVQLDTNQEELVILGRRGDALVVVAYVNGLGFGGITNINGAREWLGPTGVVEPPLLAAADLADDDDGSGQELLLVEPTGLVRCLDLTEVALIPSCDEVQLSEP